jgi:hypothetical protein
MLYIFLYFYIFIYIFILIYLYFMFYVLFISFTETLPTKVKEMKIERKVTASVVSMWNGIVDAVVGKYNGCSNYSS